MSPVTTSRSELLRRHLSQRILVLDGAMGTAIQKFNLTAEDFGGSVHEGCNENLVLTRPEVIRRIHESYLEAGCDIIETNTFGATPLVLDEYKLGSRSHEINVTAAKLAADSVETAKIADLNVTEGKLAANAVTSAKISALTQARLGGACDVQVVFMATAAQTDFPVAHTDMDGTAAGHQVFKNGILLELGAGNDYTFVDGGAGVDKIVFPAGLALDTKVLIRYRRTSLVG